MNRIISSLKWILCALLVTLLSACMHSLCASPCSKYFICNDYATLSVWYHYTPDYTDEETKAQLA